MTYPNIEKTTNTKLAARRRALRLQANDANLWALCANAACRRAHACRGDPNDCMTSCLLLLPEEAQEGVRIMAEGRERGISFDKLRVDHPPEIDAVLEWDDLVFDSVWRKR